MPTILRRHFVAGTIAVTVYGAGAAVIDAVYALPAYAFDAKSSLAQNGGRGASMSQQTDRMGKERDRQRGEHAREILRDNPHVTMSSDTNNGGSASYGGDRTGGGGGPK
jgi:hypothetical protein